MNEIFISYSRQDSDFVRKLTSDLKQAGVDPWLDIEDLPPASLWREELLIAIQASHNFIFVISPDSCQSEHCNRELSHALLHDKRVIPILFKKMPFSSIPIPLQELNWINFQEDYGEAIRLLLALLDSPFGISQGHRLDSKIEILSGFRKSFYLYRNQYLLGRSPEGSILEYGLIFLPGRQISRTHATLKRIGERWNVRDGYAIDRRKFGTSLNGIFLNGSKIEPGAFFPLKNNDCLELGQTIVLYTELLEEAQQREHDDRDTLTDPEG